MNDTVSFLLGWIGIGVGFTVAAHRHFLKDETANPTRLEIVKAWGLVVSAWPILLVAIVIEWVTKKSLKGWLSKPYKKQRKAKEASDE